MFRGAFILFAISITTRPRTLQESANHPHKTNESYDNQTTQPNASKEQTQCESLVYDTEQTNVA